MRGLFRFRGVWLDDSLIRWNSLDVPNATIPDAGGGSCPYVYTWNGERYVADNNLLPASETSNGSDVNDYYRLEQPLVPIRRNPRYSLYSLQIREWEHELDYFDEVKLLAVDYASGVNVAVTTDGNVLTYGNPISPISAVDEDGQDVLAQLSSADNCYYQSHNGSFVTVAYTPSNITDSIKLVVREDGPTGPPLLKCPVDVQVLNSSGYWSTVSTFFTRMHWATDIIDMSDYLPATEGNVTIRLCFISDDKIDYLGLDTSSQAPLCVQRVAPIRARNSLHADVTPLLAASDQNYAEIYPGEQIDLTFRLLNGHGQERTFILFTEGHYDTIA